MTKLRQGAFTAFAAAGVLGLTLTGCSGGGGGGTDIADDCEPAHSGLSTVSDGELTVGISDMPPLVIPEGEGGFDGLDADIIKGFAEAECLPINPVTVGATAAVTSVEQERVDTSLGGWSRTAERDEILALSDPMYLDGVIVAAPKEYSNWDEIEGLKIGAVQGYVVQGELEKAFPGQVTTYPEPTLLAEDLKSGRIDVAVDVSSSVNYYSDDATISVLEPDERLATTVEPIQTGLPFSKDNPELRDAFNDYIHELHDAGDMPELLEKWNIDPSMADVGEPRLI